MGGKTPAGEGPSATSAGYFFSAIIPVRRIIPQDNAFDLIRFIHAFNFLYGLECSANLYCLRDF